MIILELFLVKKIFKFFKIIDFFKKTSKLCNSASKVEKEKWLSDSIKLLFNQLLSSFRWTIDFFIIYALYPNSEEIGYYALILVIVNILIIIPNSISNILMPNISYLLTNHKKNELQRLINKINLVNFPLLTLLTVIILFSSQNLLNLFGENYEIANTSLIIITLSYFILGLVNPANIVYTYINTINSLKINLLEITIIAILGFVFTILYSITGMAIVMLLTAIIRFILISLCLKNEMKITTIFIG